MALRGPEPKDFFTSSRNPRLAPGIFCPKSPVKNTGKIIPAPVFFCPESPVKNTGQNQKSKILVKTKTISGSLTRPLSLKQKKFQKSRPTWLFLGEEEEEQEEHVIFIVGRN